MKKLLNKKGFTLMEMMIVIAIIVILVAIAVPSFNSSLDSANEATDDANLRAAKAVAIAESIDFEGTTPIEKYYSIETGGLVDDATGLDYGKSGDNVCIKVTISSQGQATAE